MIQMFLGNQLLTELFIHTDIFKPLLYQCSPNRYNIIKEVHATCNKTIWYTVSFFAFHALLKAIDLQTVVYIV